MPYLRNMSTSITIPPNVGGADRDPRVAVRVVRALGDATDREPSALSPLYESVDPDALDTLCEHARDRSTPLRVAFAHDGVDVEVEVSADGQIRIDAAP